jgi:hypothetical protein
VASPKKIDIVKVEVKMGSIMEDGIGTKQKDNRMQPRQSTIPQRIKWKKLLDIDSDSERDGYAYWDGNGHAGTKI